MFFCGTSISSFINLSHDFIIILHYYNIFFPNSITLYLLAYSSVFSNHTYNSIRNMKCMLSSFYLCRQNRWIISSLYLSALNLDNIFCLAGSLGFPAATTATTANATVMTTWTTGKYFRFYLTSKRHKSHYFYKCFFKYSLAYIRAK